MFKFGKQLSARQGGRRVSVSKIVVIQTVWHSNSIGVATSAPGVAKMVYDVQENEDISNGWDYSMARISRPPPTHYFHLRWDGQIEEIGAPQDNDRNDDEKMVSLG